MEHQGYFAPPNDFNDEREKRNAEIAQRRGQPQFRKKLLSAYEERCAISGCDATAALEAAHISPYLGEIWNHVTNGLLLRSDLHTLFDLDLIAIDPTSFRISIADELQGSYYSKFAGKSLRLPTDNTAKPNAEVLKRRWARFIKAKD